MWTKTEHPNTLGSRDKDEGILKWYEKVSKGVLKLSIPVGKRFMRYTAVVMASGQKDFGILDSTRRARVISRMYRFFCSAIPFCSGVYAHEVWWTNPFILKKSCIFLLTNFPTIVGSKDWIL